jgi:Transposase IS116/IS110/IS902 family
MVQIQFTNSGRKIAACISRAAIRSHRDPNCGLGAAGSANNAGLRIKMSVCEPFPPDSNVEGATNATDSSDRKQRSGISRCGSDRLRWILVEAAHTAQRTCPTARAYVERLSQKKHANVARVALARKLLAAAYALLRDGVCSDEAVFAA